MRVIVVDDDTHVLALAARMLRVYGHKAIVRGSAQEALSEIPEGPFILLTDFAMPGMDGLDLWREIRARAGPRAECLLMSGTLNDGVRERAKALGVRAVIEKPFSLEDLAQAFGKLP